MFLGYIHHPLRKWRPYYRSVYVIVLYWLGGTTIRAPIRRTVFALTLPFLDTLSSRRTFEQRLIRLLHTSCFFSTNSNPEAMDRLEASSTKNIVIIGGGIQGAAVAYYVSELSKKYSALHMNISVLEAVSIGSAASGKGGGFMAKTWGSGTPTQSLHEVSFDLYKELACTLNCTSYRKLPVLSVTPPTAIGSSYRSTKSVQSIWPDWLDEARIGNAQVMGTGTDTAQVTPLEITEKLIQAAQVQVILGQCIGIELEDGSSNNSKVTGVRYVPGNELNSTRAESQVLPADQIVVCAGPWSCSLVDWIQQNDGNVDKSRHLQLPMEGIKSTSIVFPPPSSSEDNGGDVDATALFCGEDGRYNTHLEVYPRPDGTVYICGIGGSDYVSTNELRQSAFLHHCPPNEQRVQAALSAFQSMVSIRSVAYNMQTKDELDRTQACMRPCPPDALPYMGSIPGYDGLYINAGHNCWGIAWAPACGLAMAELLLYGQSKSIDLSPFYPARFTPSLAKYSRGRKQGNANVGEQW